MAEFRRFECDRCTKKIPENENLYSCSVGKREPNIKVDTRYFIGDGIMYQPDKQFDLCESCHKAVQDALSSPPRKGLFG